MKISLNKANLQFAGIDFNRSKKIGKGLLKTFPDINVARKNLPDNLLAKTLFGPQGHPYTGRTSFSVDPFRDVHRISKDTVVFFDKNDTTKIAEKVSEGIDDIEEKTEGFASIGKAVWEFIKSAFDFD